MNHLKLLKKIIVLYGVWLFFIFLSVKLFSIISIPPQISKVLSFPVLFIYVLAASASTGLYLKSIEPEILCYKYLRPLLLCTCLIIFVSGWKYSVYSGSRSFLISVINNTFLLFFSHLTGAWISGKISKITEIAILALVMFLTDLISVINGPSAEVAAQILSFYKNGQTGNSPFADFILFKFPFPGSAVPLPVFGVSDWIIVVFLSAVSIKFSIADNLFKKSFSAINSAYLPIAAAGLFLAVITAWITGLFIPALPVIAFVYCGFLFFKYPEAFRFSRKEKQTATVFTAALLLIMMLGSFFLK